MNFTSLNPVSSDTPAEVKGRSGYVRLLGSEEVREVGFSLLLGLFPLPAKVNRHSKRFIKSKIVIFVNRLLHGKFGQPQAVAIILVPLVLHTHPHPRIGVAAVFQKQHPLTKPSQRVRASRVAIPCRRTTSAFAQDSQNQDTTEPGNWMCQNRIDPT